MDVEGNAALERQGLEIDRMSQETDTPRAISTATNR